MTPASPYHCERCGKLKRKRDGSWHTCGPTDRQRLAQLEADLHAWRACADKLAVSYGRAEDMRAALAEFNRLKDSTP